MKTKYLLLQTGLALGLIHSAWAQPVITTQPRSKTNVVGSAVTLSVEVAGTPTLNYQWRRSSANLAGKTNTTLAFANLQTTDAGNYTVVVTNVEGAVTSVTALPSAIISTPAVSTRRGP